ncbi:CGNR zinc finger domain-containing protein [Paenibacillus xylanilyticus]|uniref:CGNR zinc finger domain-containing protein n=1 Tax=Paenibacillus xylanilyticus TaxID=248903 RepID=A0A7Y6EW08_9BACL|nr:CGNR zinc finger domain-containing protein [Paenibacillus xylanilyticus]NUU78847.1 CGNR zinc finger domain-containing protein [Paenibacillus xylanilyticus]
MDRLWTDFVNSDYHDWRGGDRSEDRLAKPEWQQWFLEQWRLQASIPASIEDETSMRKFRNELQAVATRLSEGASLTDEEREWLNAIMEKGRGHRKLSVDEQQLRVEWIPVGAHWQQVMAEVAADFAITLTQGEGARIRICENADCRWVFYDDTRSRTQKYCDDKMCGNLMKVRRFRAKRKGEQQK